MGQTDRQGLLLPRISAQAAPGWGGWGGEATPSFLIPSQGLHLKGDLLFIPSAGCAIITGVNI